MNNNNIEHILVKYPEQDRGFLIPILQDVQQYQGYIAPEMVNEIQDFTGIQYLTSILSTDARWIQPYIVSSLSSSGFPRLITGI